MKSSSVIRVERLSKAFNFYSRPVDLLYEMVSGTSRHDVFWALRDLNLEVAEGDRIGIIGPNGAGKSTLLKLITGSLSPTSGVLEVNGKVSSMLSLTSFLNERETGLENIQFNLRILGIPEREIPDLTAEIIEFTELGSFIHAPVQTYSSGMNARLAFGITTAITPEILIVDEVLGVGDGYFVGKATERMIQLCEKGKALLYVSHSLSTLQMLCNSAIWLDKGEIRMRGAVGDVVKAYEEDFRRREDKAIRAQNRLRSIALDGSALPEDFADPSVWRLRIVSQENRLFHDIHYINRIELRAEGNILPISLSGEASGSARGYLDIMDSEWGRPYERGGVECRILSTNTGKRRGGHILLLKPKGYMGTEYPIEIAFNHSVANSCEMLAVEYLNEASGEWQRLESNEKVEEEQPKPKSWRASVFSGALPLVGADVIRETQSRVVQAHAADVVINECSVVVANEETQLITEREAFRIKITASIRRTVPVLDFGVRIFRSDGVYVFWQTTGETSGNVAMEPGEAEIYFEFNPNLFPAGEYQVTVYAGNGWDPDRNYPYSEVFDRKINATTFSIRREHAKIDYGALNQRVETQIRVSTDAIKKDPEATSGVISATFDGRKC